MDFFHGLDNAKYGAFKMVMLSRWETKAVKPSKHSTKYIDWLGVGCNNQHIQKEVVMQQHT